MAKKPISKVCVVLRIRGMTEEMLEERRRGLEKKNDGLIATLTITDRTDAGLDLIVRPSGAHAYQYMLSANTAGRIEEAEEALERDALAVAVEPGPASVADEPNAVRGAFALDGYDEDA